MLINESVYGAENTWLNAPLSAANDGTWQWGKVANFGDNDSTLLKGNSTGKTPINAHIDKSLSWCGLGQESNYNNIYVISRNALNSPTLVTQDVLNFFFYQRRNIVSAGTLQVMTTRDNKNIAFWSPVDNLSNTSNPHRYISPFTNLYINKIVWLIYVYCATSTALTTSDTYTYADYVANHKVDHPVIRSIYARPYVYRTNNRQDYIATAGTNTNGTFSVGLFTEFPLPDTGSSTAIDYVNVDTGMTLLLFGRQETGTGNYSNAQYKYFYTLGACKNNGNLSGFHTYQDENIDDVLESALKTIACFGFYFVLDTAYVNDDLDSEHMYMGVIPENGITHGVYTHGTANRQNPNWTWTGTNDSTYDYKKKPNDTTTVFGSNTLYNTFIQYYAMSPAQLNNLCSVVYTYINSVDTSTEDINKAITKTFYTNNPLDVIVSLKKLPFNIVDYFGISSTSVPVKLGNLANAAATGYKLNGQYTVVDFGSFTVEPAFGNSFLDYSPYTYAELIIPFCGSTRIDAALFMGKTLNLKMVVDLYTGACTCYILVNNLCIDSVSGNCAIDIPVTGIQSADFQNSVQNAITNVKNARLQIKAFDRKGAIAAGVVPENSLTSALGNVVSKIGKNLGNIPAAFADTEQTKVQNEFNLQKANYDLEHVQTPFNSVGSQSAANSYVEEMQARIIIYRPILSDDFDASVYASTVGHACMKEGTVSAFSGLTVGSINVSGINASEQEKQLIQSAFASGVYL